MAIPRIDVVEQIRQVLRQYVDYHRNESSNIYANRPPDRDSYQFHLHLPIMVELEISGMLTHSIQNSTEAQKLVDQIIRILDNKREDLNRVSRDLSSGDFVFPGYELDTVMEFSL